MGNLTKTAAVAMAGLSIISGAAQAQTPPPGVTVNEQNTDVINNNTAVGEANADVQIEGSFGLALSSMPPSDGSGSANRFLVCEGRGISTPIISWGRDCQLDPEFTALLMEHERELANAGSAGALLGFLTERYYDIKLQQLENEGRLSETALEELLEHGFNFPHNPVGGEAQATRGEHNEMAYGAALASMPERVLRGIDVAQSAVEERGSPATDTDLERRAIVDALLAAHQDGRLDRESFGEITSDYDEFMVQAARTVVFYHLSTGNIGHAVAVNDAISAAFEASGIGYEGDDGQTYYGTGLVFPTAEQVHDLNAQP